MGNRIASPHSQPPTLWNATIEVSHSGAWEPGNVVNDTIFNYCYHANTNTDTDTSFLPILIQYHTLWVGNSITSQGIQLCKEHCLKVYWYCALDFGRGRCQLVAIYWTIYYSSLYWIVVSPTITLLAWCDIGLLIEQFTYIAKKVHENSLTFWLHGEPSSAEHTVNEPVCDSWTL